MVYCIPSWQASSGLAGFSETLTADVDVDDLLVGRSRDDAASLVVMLTTGALLLYPGSDPRRRSNVG